MSPPLAILVSMLAAAAVAAAPAAAAAGSAAPAAAAAELWMLLVVQKCDATVSGLPQSCHAGQSRAHISNALCTQLHDTGHMSTVRQPLGCGVMCAKGVGDVGPRPDLQGTTDCNGLSWSGRSVKSGNTA